ncbi:MAG: hypothetical protein EZS28_043562 [Streblomastix strix]|uniref:Uncharacterized protein n=1 Tax=Streblomastix strix TaxID=222440 RepID=A0A5J4TTQ7_9EUKA|nr:MAG: hypothetical protein EZS28_043562 [Streblomastix strix]
MQMEQEIQNAARAIVSFADSYTQNKQRKQNELTESESTLSLAQVTSSLESLWRQIGMNKSSKQEIQIPRLLKSLIALVTFRLGTHLREEIDLLRTKLRHWSIWCLGEIVDYGDEQVQSELVSNESGRVMTIAFCKAGGFGEEQDDEINDGLICISVFLRQLHEGRNNYPQPSFQPLPLLARRTEEQIEEEGAIEEIEAQLNNNGFGGDIKSNANDAKAETLNRFIDSSNQQPFWYR